MPGIIDINSLPKLSPSQRKVAVTLGNFDGLHRGHQALLQSTAAKALALGTTPAAISFTPHPDVFFGKIVTEDLPLMTPEQKHRAFAELGIPNLHILNFNSALAATSAPDFYQKILRDWLDARAIIIGHDFKFGAKRQGGAELLADSCRRDHIDFSVQTVVGHEGAVASSTLVRDLLINGGKVADLIELLGRPYVLEGNITSGQQLGRRIGFPTLNVKDIHQLLPKIGVYVGWVYVPEANEGAPVMRLPQGALPAVFNIGKRPTVSREADQIHIEAHVLAHLPERETAISRVGLYLTNRLRDERKFPDIDALKAQIATDIDQAKRLLGI